MKRTIGIMVFVLALALPFAMNAQIVYEVKSHSLTIEGTSNLHDWTADVEDVKGTFNIKVENGKIVDVPNLAIKVDATSLKGSRGNIMNSKINEALNSKKHPEITFRMNRVNSITENPDSYRLSTSGILNVSGVNRNVTLNAVGRILPGGDIEFSGTTKLKMSDFNVSPPTAMFGALTTGDEITLNYKVVVKPSQVTEK